VYEQVLAGPKAGPTEAVWLGDRSSGGTRQSLSVRDVRWRDTADFVCLRGPVAGHHVISLSIQHVQWQDTAELVCSRFPLEGPDGRLSVYTLSKNQ